MTLNDLEWPFYDFALNSVLRRYVWTLAFENLATLKLVVNVVGEL